MYGTQKLGEWLIQRGTITQEQLEQALEKQKTSGKRLGEILLELGWITLEDLWQAQADQYEVPYESLELSEWDSSLKQLVPAEVASHHFIFPVCKRNQTLRLAMADPNNIEALDWVRQATALQVEPCFSPAEKILQAIANWYDVVEESLLDTESEHEEEWMEQEDISQVRRSMNEPPVIRLVNSLLFEAIEKGVSDIHFEPQERHLDVRYRIDGLLYRMRVIPKNLQASVLSRVKLLAEMDIAERRRPQDGRFTVRVGSLKIDVRVSSLPTVYGERIVLRLLDRQRSLRTLSELGFSDAIYNAFTSLIAQPWGLVLVTGPTGSGKTTTLYAALQHLRSERRNILTSEDPVEYALEGIGQSQVNERAGVTFAAQLRSILRQDPDIILVGEIRDQETAEIACRAAITGHLVLATLHTNDSLSAIPRLLDMGIPPFLLNSALIGVVTQRLVRRLCPHCRKPQTIEAQDSFSFLGSGTLTVFQPVGCARCDQIGYHGRIGIYELFAIHENVRGLITKNVSVEGIREATPPGYYFPMIEDAHQKVLQGVTSPEEVLAVVPTEVVPLQKAA